MTIKADHWKSDGYADPVIFSITPTSSAAGVLDCRLNYCPKASRADRDDGLAESDPQLKADPAISLGQPSMNGGAGNPYNRGVVPVRNNHPTVKPTELMRWLVRLVTRPGGLVLDPFAGSGTTGRAAILEQCSFVGVELMLEHLRIAEARVNAIDPLFVRCLVDASRAKAAP